MNKEEEELKVLRITNDKLLTDENILQRIHDHDKGEEIEELYISNCENIHGKSNWIDELLSMKKNKIKTLSINECQNITFTLSDINKLREKYKNENIQNLRHLFEGRQDNKQSTINWELGLRNTHEYNKKISKIKESENNESPTKNVKSNIPKWDTISYEIPKHVNYEDLSKIYKLKKIKLQEKRNQLKSQKK